MATWYMIGGLQERYWSTGSLVKADDAVSIGLLSTAKINESAVIWPARSSSNAIVAAVASRNLESARKYAAQHSIPKAYGSYDELLQDPDIMAVFIGLPNGMHYEWALKSLKAGKHVLLEKPVASNAEQTRELFREAGAAGKVLLEAYHYEFHPAAHVVQALVASGKYGRVLQTKALMTSPAGFIPTDDIRFKYELAGGCLMDFGYVIASTRYFLDGDFKNVVSAYPRLFSDKIDEAMDATLLFESNGSKVTSTIHADMNQTRIFGIPKAWEAATIIIELERATIKFYNFIHPHVYHYISIFDKTTGSTSTQKHYNFGPKWGVRGEPWWTTYRYQLEAFIDKVQGREPAHWVTAEDSIAHMEIIDEIYRKAGLPTRN